MKTRITHYIICFLLAFSFAGGIKAQSNFGKSKTAESNIRKEQKREKKRVDANNKKAAKAEKRIQKKAKYKNRRKAKSRERKSRLKN